MLIHLIYFFSFNACGDLRATNYLYKALIFLHNIFFFIFEAKLITALK